ncbi:N-acetylmuramoyl-L-alanine amidase [Tepidibacillus fermentans]|uniref:N-acetylmuramoyl-L-alanine amidase n=1 Tax=Tepidibacillus fermentans TaxID=1281767 RepID=A0A4R3KK70_9BACI|nr:N-acetylmuramoyl-L-alanine amidase [Tepidibacillus fermentans]
MKQESKVNKTKIFVHTPSRKEGRALKRRFLFNLLLVQFVIFSAIMPQQNVYSSTIATVKGNIINVRKGPGLEYDILAQIKQGEKYPVLEEKYGWDKIKIGNYYGWVADWLVEKNVSETNKSEQTVKAAIQNLNVRSGPSTSFPIIGQIHNDKYYLIVDQEGDWLKIQLKPGQQGWVAKWLTKQSNTPPSKETSKKEFVKIQSNRLNVRSGPSTTYSVIGQLLKGDQIEVFEIKNGWYRIRYNNQDSWIASQYASKVDHNEEMTNLPKVFITLPGTNIRKEPTTYSPIIAVVQKGEQFPIIGTEGDWYLIQLPSGQKAYVAGWIVSVTGIEKKIKHGIENALAGRTIVVDAGHGGYDSGSIGTYFNTKEKDVNLAVAKLLQKKLEASGANVIMTRDSDYKVSLEQRTYLAIKNQADAFISIHHNTISNPQIKGTITYYYKNIDQKLAQTVHRELLKQNKQIDLNPRFGNFFVLRENPIRSILVELTFLTNYEDELQARSPIFQERSAEGIFQGVIKYFQDK